MQHTWGIPGATFIACFIASMVAIAVFAAIHRKVLFRGNRDVRVDHLGPQHVAYLNGGEKLAVYAALGGLRAAHAIGTGPGHKLTQTGPLTAGMTTLDAAIHNAAGRGVRARELKNDQWVRSRPTSCAPTSSGEAWRTAGRRSTRSVRGPFPQVCSCWSASCG
jgi:uncharacterized protein (TIGR04222 family)